ncbi:E set domain-containing protein [Suhomyces tanzawaensis NRRL Y-17324]|uniref:Rho GDP-dissociation inhibitor n=1 Tax=Suhomyces tanzawaensis NRRL Y-17324 TaxID=984487 RepID=A0A1E4SC68_9ASCO|nr:E set domain-containing protein [Suhomyces tanzawaensis NRRL Y-17324]ODV77078.1 E set domain-containing protein [Suhomyces tanzawaensis NRRL Y-17324]
MSNAEDDLVPESVEGYTVGEKKTIQEYTKLDAEDESLAKWKASLGLSDDSSAYPVKAGDTRKVVVVELGLEFPEQPELKPIVINLEDADGNTIAGKEIKFSIKERAVYQLVVKFRVQHEIVTGLKYLHSVKKAGIRVEKLEEPLGSYAPNTKDKPYYERKFPEVEAPSGMLARGNYSATSKFVDDDKHTHLTVPWSFTITK